MGFYKEVILTEDQESQLKKICNNDAFINDIREAAGNYKALVSDEVDNFKSSKQAQKPLDEITSSISVLMNALHEVDRDDRLRDSLLTSSNDFAFLTKIRTDLTKLQTMSFVATRNVKDNENSFLNRTALRSLLVEDIKDILINYGFEPVITKGDSWELCAKIAFAACGENVSTPLNAIRKLEKARKSLQV